MHQTLLTWRILVDHRINRYIFVVCLLLLVCLSACQGRASTPTSLPAAQTTIQPSSTPTLTPAPMLTPTATATATATLTPTKTPIPTVVQIIRENLAAFKPMAVYGDGELLNLSWSSDRKTVALCFNHAIRLMTWDGKLQPLNRISSIQPLGECALSPDGQRVVAGVPLRQRPARLFVWDASSGDEIAVLDGGMGGIDTVEFAPDGSFFVTAGWNETQVWNTVDLSKRYAFDQGSGFLAVSPDSRLVASSNGADTFYVWDVSTDAPSIEPVSNDLNGFWIVDMEFAQDSNTLMLARSGALEFWDLQQDLKTDERSYSKCLNFELEILQPDQVFAFHCSYDDGTTRKGNLMVRDMTAGRQLLNIDYSSTEKVVGAFPRISPGPDANSIFLIHNTDDTIQIEQVDLASGSRAYIYEQASLGWCIGRDDRNEFIRALTKIFPEDLNAPPDRELGQVPNKPGYFISKQAVSPDGKLAAFVYTKVDGQKLLGGELDVFRIPIRFGDTPLLTFENLLAKSSEQDIPLEDAMGFRSMVFTPDQSWVTATTHNHLLTWNLENGQLISDVDLESVDGYPYWDFAAVRDMVYTKDNLLIASVDGWLYFVDPRGGEIIGVEENGIMSGHNLVMNRVKDTLYQSTCSYSANYENPERWWSANRVIVLWGIEPSLTSANSTLAELPVLPTHQPSAVIGGVYLANLEPVSVEGNGDFQAKTWPFSEGPAVKDQPISAAGEEYSNGLFAHAYSSIRYRIDYQYALLKVDLVMANYPECTSDGVLFAINVDDQPVYEKFLTLADSPVHVEVPINGRFLSLDTSPGPDDDFNCDWSVWGDPILIR